MGKWMYSSTILDLGKRFIKWLASRPGCLLPWKEPQVTTGQEAMWNQGPVWTPGIERSGVQSVDRRSRWIRLLIYLSLQDFKRFSELYKC